MRALGLVGLLLGDPCAAVPPVPDDPALAACMERVLPRQSLSQTLAFRVFDRSGSVSESRAKLYWKRFEDGLSRIVVRLFEPAQRAGIALLLIERSDADPQMFLYLPELRRTRRITGAALAGNMLGTDFSYEDFTHLQGLATASASSRLPDERADGTRLLVLETRPLAENSDYARIVSHIEQKRCVPRKIAFFAANGVLSKELVVDRDSIVEVDGRWLPTEMAMVDHRQESRTELVVERVEIDSALADSLFSPLALGAAR